MDFPRFLLEKSLRMCQDQEPELRKVMAAEILEKLSNVLTPDEIEIMLLPKVLFPFFIKNNSLPPPPLPPPLNKHPSHFNFQIMELIYDIDINVKGEAIRLIFRLSGVLSPDCVRNRLVGLFLELLGTHNEELTKKVSLFLGEILTRLEVSSALKSGSFLSAAAKGFKDYATHKIEEVRRNFARSLVPILQVLDARLFLESLKTAFLNLLLNDKSKEVRLICLGQLPEVMGKVGFESANKDFKPALVRILKEDDKEILRKLTELLEPIIVSLIPDQSMLYDEMITVVISRFIQFFVLFLLIHS